jgi:3-dehydroquinate dehydratase
LILLIDFWYMIIWIELNDDGKCIHFLRPTWEGGKYDGDENQRLDALRLAMELGADYIDIELKVCLFSLVFLSIIPLFHLT